MVTADTTTLTKPEPAPIETQPEPRAKFGDREHLLGRLFLFPAVVYVVALVAVPFFVAIAYSLSDVTTGDPSFDFVGLRQYRAILHDSVFWQSLWNTLLRWLF